MKSFHFFFCKEEGVCFEMEQQQQIQVFVVPPTTGAATFALMASLETTVATLAAEIAKRTSIASSQQVLTHCGASMSKTSTLRDLNIQDGAHIHVTPALVGGCGCSCCTIL